MKTKKVLVKARSLIEKGWTQKALARDAHGEKVHPKDPNACEWCATGALRAVLVNISDYSDLLTSQAPSDIILFNDNTNTTKEDILAVFDKAIERCDDDH